MRYLLFLNSFKIYLVVVSGTTDSPLQNKNSNKNKKQNKTKKKQTNKQKTTTKEVILPRYFLEDETSKA